MRLNLQQNQRSFCLTDLSIRYFTDGNRTISLPNEELLLLLSKMYELESLSLDIELSDLDIKQLLQKNKFEHLRNLKLRASSAAIISFLECNVNLENIHCNDTESVMEYVIKNNLAVEVKEL